jgi:hypothetical protein
VISCCAKFKERRGSASLWTFFVAAVLIAFSVLIYTGMTVQNKYLQAMNEIERAANISLDANLSNPMVRDIQLSVPLGEVESQFEANLLEAGFSYSSDQIWIRQKDGRTVYSICDYSFNQDGERYLLTATLNITLPWGPLTSINLPVQAAVQILFLDFS